MGERILETDEMSDGCAAVQKVCALLVTPSPENLDRAAAILDAVTRGMMHKGPPTGERRRIRRTAQAARALLEKASAYHLGWNAWMGSRIGGYGPGGEAAGVTTRGRLSVEG